MAEIDIRSKRGYYEVYVDGKFFCTADTYGEAIDILEEENYL